MDEALRNRLLDLFDANPACPADYRKIVRKLVTRLPHLDALEAEIMAWDAGGRDASEFEHLRKRAWDFEETGEAAYRKRLFAGFVTTADSTDGHGADFLIDTALALGIPSADINAAMTSCASF